jgi:hypothetical protein
MSERAQDNSILRVLATLPRATPDPARAARTLKRTLKKMGAPEPHRPPGGTGSSFAAQSPLLKSVNST